MDNDRVKGKAKNMGGRAQEAWGDVTNQPEHEIKGQAKQAEGNVQEGYGRLKDEVRERTEERNR
jgi:uncharacterized protein YjbJ (UPF0337 family)